MIADRLMKMLLIEKFENFINQLGLMDIGERIQENQPIDENLYQYLFNDEDDGK